MTRSEILYQLYHVEGLSLRQVATRLELSSGTVRYHLKRCGVPRRTKSEALAGTRNPMFGKSKPERVRKQTSETLLRTLSDPKIRKHRSDLVLGSNNPMYGRTHTSEVKEASRQRLSVIRLRSDFQDAHKMAMSQPSVRKLLALQASKRTGSKNPFFGKTHSEETRVKISSANLGRFQGENGSNWQGGRTSLNLLIRSSENSIRWRKAVLERDNYTCQTCGKRGGKLHVDHIQALALLLREHPVRTLAEAQACEYFWDLANGRTLCVPCHNKTPSFAGNLQRNFGRNST